MKTKICKKCSINKEVENFYKNKKLKDGYESKCKTCTLNENKIKVEVNGGVYLGKKNYDKYKEEINKKRREFRHTNKDITKYYNDNTKEYRYNYTIENKEKIREYQKSYDKYKKETDILYKVKSIVRNNIHTLLKNKNVKKYYKTEEILGCSFDELKIHLESMFEIWMAWDNHGKYNGELNYGWDIDHKIPLSSANTIDELYELSNYKNLQPLCSYTNRYIKKDKLDYEK